MTNSDPSPSPSGPSEAPVFRRYSGALIDAGTYEGVTIMKRDIREWVAAEEVERLVAQLLAAKEDEKHRCSGCGHRWEGPLPCAELCGECWRRAQAVILGPPVHRVTPPALRGEAIRKETCATHGDPLVCLACEAEENAHPSWWSAPGPAAVAESWRSLIARWRERAADNRANAEFNDANFSASHAEFADIRAECADDLEALMANPPRSAGEAPPKRTK